jgi:hypothetical protein
MSVSINKKLLQPYLNMGHCLYTDNLYTYPVLVHKLQQWKTGVYGTVRKNRKGMPKFHLTLQKCEVESRHTENVIVLRWQDKCEVCVITTMHKN